MAEHLHGYPRCETPAGKPCPPTDVNYADCHAHGSLVSCAQSVVDGIPTSQYHCVHRDVAAAAKAKPAKAKPKARAKSKTKKAAAKAKPKKAAKKAARKTAKKTARKPAKKARGKKAGKKKKK
jgi:hypothetical protein